MIRAFILAVVFAFLSFLVSYAFREYAISRNWDRIPRVWPGIVYTFVVTLLAWGIPALNAGS